jgi:L-Lysine epsilon oxidase N-terminal/L-lysine epsilon oxidase C-terminal domain/Iron-containing redox enzyme
MMREIAYCATYPGIGVARVGNSPDEYFIGLERPGRPMPPIGGYKDASGGIKRQAARFRLFAFDDEDKVVQELTAADAEIVWAVQLANRKAAAERFHRPNSDTPVLRNSAVLADKRDRLVIDPGPREISGRNTHGAPYHFDSGAFLDNQVELGELRTDDDGRLLVLGGHGHSASPTGDRLTHFADNDNWHDDVSDGPVTARVTLTSGAQRRQLEVRHTSWVVVGPPDYAPSIGNVVTLYDLAEQVAVDRGWLPQPARVSFARDIQPLLARVAGYRWVSASAARGHREAWQRKPGEVERRGDFLDPDYLALLRDPGDGVAAAARHQVFELVRQPRAPEDVAAKQANARYMPQLSGDEGPAAPDKPGTWLALTAVQYDRLAMWARGEFTPAEPERSLVEPPSADGAVPEPGPDDLDRAALEACVGGPFYPGIEMSDRSREPSSYAAPFRFRPDLQPGSITERMAVPWQADFADCHHFWWPAQRPDDIITEEEARVVERGLYPKGSHNGRPATTAAFRRQRWDRGIGDELLTALDWHTRSDRRHHEMVQEWAQLGFVVPGSVNNSEVWMETERDRYVGLRHRDYFHIMLNPNDHPGFFPDGAKRLAEQFLQRARDAQHDPLFESDLRRFDYNERAFDARLDNIYQDLVDAARRYDPKDPKIEDTFRTRADVIERLRQSAPLNQTDGVWLRNVAPIGPINDVEGFLTRIWIDEYGGGDPAQNHANLYTSLLASVGIETAPLNSADYINDPAFYDSAFTLPLLQLVVSQFTKDYFPEILGMTLYFEWESSAELATTLRLLETHKIDGFFFRLHVAIDNPAAGHGAMAKRAVQRYLATVRQLGGEGAMQEQWQRVWDGYVAFRTTGTLGQDLREELRSTSRARDRVIRMIEQKALYGSLNHGSLAAGSGMSNNLFDSPADMLSALVAKGQVVPGDPEASLLLRQFDFRGRMYMVFTPAERQLWEDWIRSLATESPQAAQADPTAAAAKPWGDAQAAEPAESVPQTVPRLLHSSPSEAFENHPRQTLLGHGSVQ